AVRNVLTGPAPSTIAASSSAGSSSASTGSTARTTNGRVTNSSASTIPGRAKTTSNPQASSRVPTNEVGPYKVASITPATSVGTASGRSISADTRALPGNRWRTKIHAVAVPNSVLIPPTSSALQSVSQSAARATGDIARAQNVARPSASPNCTRPTSGTATSTTTYRITPER